MATTRDDKRERSKVPWLNVRISPEERAELDDYLANDPQLSRMDKGAAIAYLIELGVERYQQDQSVLSLVKEKRKEHDDHIARTIATLEDEQITSEVAGKKKESKQTG